MFENLSERLERSFKILKGEGKITEVNISEAMKDIRRALLDADVSYKIAKQFCDDVKKKAIGQNVLTAVKPQQMIVKIVHDELAALMGSNASDINLKGSPAVVLVAGLNGSGKTTFSGKLALNIKSKRGMKVLLAACDYFRPAAIDQLKVLGEQIGVEVYSEPGVMDPIQIAQNAIKKAKSEGYSVVIVDTAGRLAVDQELMDEISALHSAVQPTETLFVVDAMTGQDAVETAKAFNERLDFDGGYSHRHYTNIVKCCQVNALQKYYLLFPQFWVTLFLSRKNGGICHETEHPGAAGPGIWAGGPEPGAPEEAPADLLRRDRRADPGRARPGPVFVRPDRHHRGSGRYAPADRAADHPGDFESREPIFRLLLVRGLCHRHHGHF